MGGARLLHHLLPDASLWKVSNADLPLERAESVSLGGRDLAHRALAGTQNITFVPLLRGDDLDAWVLGEVIREVHIEPHLSRGLPAVLTGHERVGLGLDHLLDSLALSLQGKFLP